MLLRSLSMYGFKSFADKLHITFGSGITAIIGPNGCGKSNVIDAIRWVFGEQKASALRSANMQEVIFSGTQKRQQLNMAEVTLTLNNATRVLPIEYGQVAITRRIFRSGESEYRINKIPCRLRDIHNLFLDTGIGSSAYTTIENNMINQILSDKAEERRILFEEAAGIGKYKKRRKESQRQLERTTQDLLRINDKVQEADRQVRMLARHVEKAKRYKRYYDDLKSLEIGFENTRYQYFSKSISERKKEMQELEEQHTLLKSKLSAAESEIEKMQLTAMEKENELQITSRNVSDAAEKVNELDREISVSVERLHSLDDRADRFGKEQENIESDVQQKKDLRMQIEKSLIERESKHEECRLRVDGAQDELEAFDAKMNRARQSAEELSAEQIECINAISDNRNSKSNLAANLNNSLERLQRYEKEIETLENRIEEYQETNQRCRRELESSSDAQTRLQQSRETLLSRIESEDEKYQKYVEEEKRCEAQIDASKSQLKFLSGLNASFEGYESGVKALLSNGKDGIKGIAADCFDVTDESVIGLIEKALGTMIQTVVVESDSHLSGAVDFLRDENAGNARLLSLERVTAHQKHNASEIANATSLRSLVKTAPEYTELADTLLGNVYATESADLAMSLSQTHADKGLVFVSRDGLLCYSDGSVVAGSSKNEDAGLLLRRKQIEELTNNIEVLEKKYQTIIHEKEVCIINRDEAKFALVEVDEKINHGRQVQQEQETIIRHNENEIENTQLKIEELTADLDKLRGQINDFEDKLSACESELAARQSRLEALQEKVEESKSNLSTMDTDRKTLADHLKNVELEMLGLANRINQDKSDIERLHKEIESLGKRKTALIREQQDTATEKEDLKSKIEAFREQLVTQKEKREHLEEVNSGVREEYNGILAHIDEFRKSNKTIQNDLDNITQSLHNFEMKHTSDEQERRRIRERLWEAYEIDIESHEDPLPTIDEEEAVVIENIQVLKERIKRVGQVNMAALEDFEVESARLEELTKQRDDLQTGVSDLEKAIKKLDKEAREQFIQTFQQVQKNFTDMFTRLFNGGEANITLEEGVDPLVAPIHINVRPAGKKMRGVQLLSGGERALTAIALLFGLYLVKPSAYCILDELDAPLDDANVERFTRILNNFTDRTQFIIITHNKRTMEAADVLYGVTQQEKGISKIVSVKFDEAMLQAA